MIEFLKKNKVKVIVVIIFILFSVYVINGIYEHSIIPEHIHSIDDKAPEQRTDLENITVLERILQKDPGNVNIMIQLSELYIKTGNKKSAKKTLIKILEIDPSNKEASELLKQLEF